MGTVIGRLSKPPGDGRAAEAGDSAQVIAAPQIKNDLGPNEGAVVPSVR